MEQFLQQLIEAYVNPNLHNPETRENFIKLKLEGANDMVDGGAAFTKAIFDLFRPHLDDASDWFSDRICDTFEKLRHNGMSGDQATAVMVALINKSNGPSVSTKK